MTKKKHAVALPSPAPLSIAEIQQLTYEVRLGLRRVPDVKLDRRQRGRLDLYMFTGARVVVDEVTRSLRRDPGLFPEITIRPEAIEQGLLRGSAWFALADAASRLAVRATGNWLLEESGAVATALQILIHVRDGARAFFPLRDPDLEGRRVQAMHLAETVLAWMRPGPGRRAGRKKSA